MKRPREDDELPEELREVADLLDRTAREEQAVLEAASALDEVPGGDAVDRALERALEREWGGGVARPRRALLALAAAAAALLLFVLLRFVLGPAAPDGPGPGIRLGTDGFRIVRPAPGDADWSVIEWVHPAQEARGGMRFRVRVLDAAGESLLEPEPVEGTRLEVGAETARAWPDEIAIEVEVVDASARKPELVRASLSRSGR